MCDHIFVPGEGWNGYFTAGWDSIFPSHKRHSILLADGLEFTWSILFQWRSRWTSHGMSEFLLNDESLITQKCWKLSLRKANKTRTGFGGVCFYLFLFRYKKDIRSSLGGTRGDHIHVLGGLDTREGGGGGRSVRVGGGEKGSRRLEEVGGAVILGGCIVEEGEEFLKGPQLSHWARWGDLNLGQVVAVDAHALKEPVLLEEDGFPLDKLVSGGLVPGDLDAEIVHPLGVHKLRGKKSEVWTERVVCHKAEMEKVNGLWEVVLKIYRIKIGELGRLVRRQTLDTSLTGSMKLNFFTSMLTTLDMRSSMRPFLGSTPSPEIITTLNWDINYRRLEGHNRILPNNFLTLGVKELGVTVLLIGVDLLVQDLMFPAELGHLLGKGLQSRHVCGNLEVCFDSNVSRLQEGNHRHRGVTSDQYQARDFPLADMRHEVNMTTFRIMKKTKRRKVSSGRKIKKEKESNHLFLFHILN